MNLTKPLTNLQLELLKIYQFELKDEQLIEIKDLLARYFAKKASHEMDRLWDENGWSDKTMDTWLEDNTT